MRSFVRLSVGSFQYRSTRPALFMLLLSQPMSVDLLPAHAQRHERVAARAVQNGDAHWIRQPRCDASATLVDRLQQH